MQRDAAVKKSRRIMGKKYLWGMRDEDTTVKSGLRDMNDVPT